MHHHSVFTWAIVAVLMAGLRGCGGYRVFMITMGGTKSHTVPFFELAYGLVSRGHNVTFLNAFPKESTHPGIEEITPAGFVFFVRNFTNWDLLGMRMRGKEPVPPLDILRYPYESCEALFSDVETQAFLKSERSYDLLIIDGAYPECSLGFFHHFKAPFIYINTVGFYMGSLETAGNPTPYAVTPFLTLPYTDNMNIFQRTINAGHFIGLKIVHGLLMKLLVETTLRRHLGSSMPPVYAMSRNVSFILQNGHSSVSYPRPYLANVAEIACIHCKPSKPLAKDLEDFIEGAGDAGFIYVSMGSSVKSSNMPEYLRLLFLQVFEQLPCRVLWKWEAGEGSMSDIPSNVKLSRWLPQQDLLGHRKMRAFVTHGGLLSMFETVYHGVPVVTMPVFCDHNSNAAKAVLDGYAIKLELDEITAEMLHHSIMKVIRDPRYRENVKRRSILLRDQLEPPLERALYWAEYVIRHRGAYHLQYPAREMPYYQYFMLDVAFICIIPLLLLCTAVVKYYNNTVKRTITAVNGSPPKIKMN